MIYKKWLQLWLDNYIKPSCKARTVIRYEQIIDRHLIKELGEYDLKELTPHILQQFVAGKLKNGNIRTGGGLSSNTVNCIISVIQASLKMANALSYTDDYVGDKIVRPKIAEKQVVCFSIKEQEKIEKYIINANKIKLYGIILCLYTGLRIGELMALQVSNINLEKKILMVNKSCYDSKSGRILETPKTSSSTRVIPLPKSILCYLKKLIKNTTCNYLMVDNNKPISVRSYQRSFELLLVKLKIEHKGFHALRHTFATRALECGMDVKAVAEILGHKNATITLNRYVHSMFDYKQTMMNKLGKNLTKLS